MAHSACTTNFSLLMSRFWIPSPSSSFGWLLLAPMDIVQDLPVHSDRLAHHQGNTAFQRFTGIISSVDLPDSRVSCIIL